MEDGFLALAHAKHEVSSFAEEFDAACILVAPTREKAADRRSRRSARTRQRHLTGSSRSSLGSIVRAWTSDGSILGLVDSLGPQLTELSADHHRANVAANGGDPIRWDFASTASWTSLKAAVDANL